jgi:hypothetical protein
VTRASRSGWGNVNYHRERSPAGPSKEVVTPNLDELVKTGLELDRFYTCARQSSAQQLLERRASLRLTSSPGHATPRSADRVPVL